MYNLLCQNVPIPSNCINQKHYSVAIGSISFFLTSGIQKFHHILGCHVIGINSSLIFSSSALHFLTLLCQAKSLIRIVVSGSSSSKLLSRLILLRFTLKIPISSQKNVPSP